MVIKNSFLIVLLLLFVVTVGCANSNSLDVSKETEKMVEKKSGSDGKTEPDVSYKVTFIELGSVKCIPCKMMQPIMEEIEKEYPDVKIIFYDVWTSDGQKYGKEYKIRVIPTQVFLDKDEKEYFRHEGFFPKEDIEKVLVQGGVSKKEK